MHADDVLSFMRRLNEADIRAWLDGGWGVDALVGRQTRTHADLDLAVDVLALPQVTALLKQDGYRVLRDELPTAVAYRHDGSGRELDLHPLVITEDGGGDQAQPDGREPWHYGVPVTGYVAGQPVPCCSLETQLRAHQGYPPRDSDRADMAVLAEHFGCELPGAYRVGGAGTGGQRSG